jgi:hypothetical protein
MALGYGLDDRGSRVRFQAGAGNFSLHHRVQNGSGAHPDSYPMGKRDSFPGIKRPGCEADHSPPSRAEVNECHCWKHLWNCCCGIACSDVVTFFMSSVSGNLSLLNQTLFLETTRSHSEPNQGARMRVSFQ